MKNITSAIAIAAFFFQSCSSTTSITTKNQDMSVHDLHSQNPLMQKSSLQYEAPQFDKIKNEDFKPAFEYGLKKHTEEVLAIANNSQPATFENTLEALEKSGEVLKRAQIIFYNLTSSNTNETLQALEEEYAPIFSAHSDQIYLNDQLYKRIKSINSNALDSESKRLLEVYLQNFEVAGAALSPSAKEELKQINQELATLSTQFGSKLLEARKQGALLIQDVRELDGLSNDDIAAAAEDAKQAGHEGQYLGF